ncbi:2,6-dihydroxypyridine 3-monooxygenase [Yonghaparkia alkaliphila]|uniref:2,6-dihydroxypyridine 3-monooxygenase n=1 Tax=Microcella alkalica TaxID=355930 RepID=A0A839E731_9MICO|nr:2,6-dihydroxypyridine 3-monooxygenase [Microcella alkalica]
MGFEVDVYERTPGELDGRGGGIVLQPEVLRWFKERSELTPGQISTHSRVMRVIGDGNSVEFEEEVEWRFTSWGTLYRALLSDFGRENYHLGHTFVGLDQSSDSVSVRFANGRSADADLAIFADGITSVGRKRLLPDHQLDYVGYIGWRGTVPETQLSSETRAVLGDSLTYSFADQTHICMYPIPGPGDAVEVGGRLLNYVWYRNIPGTTELDEIMTDTFGFRGEVSVHPGKVQERYVEEMKDAASTLAPAATELVRSTAQPYIQPIMDFRPPRMVFGRAVTIGDSAFVARPHAAAGTAKAAAEAWALADALLAAKGDIDGALRAWEPRQLEVGNALLDRIKIMGRAAQIDNTWTPHDRRLRFGLLEGALQPAY